MTEQVPDYKHPDSEVMSRTTQQCSPQYRERGSDPETGAFSLFGIIESSHFHIPFSQKKFCWDLYTFQSHNLDIPSLELTYTFHIRHLWVNYFPFGKGGICDRSNQQTRGKSRASWVQVSSKASRCTWVPLQAHSKKWASHDHRDQAKASSGRFLDFRYE